jgi:hypothetical protein
MSVWILLVIAVVWAVLWKSWNGGSWAVAE